MNFKDLIYFRKLVDTRSYTSAAKELNINQPTISQAISRIERQLNTKLFLKGEHSHIVSLTDSGKVLLNSTDEILTKWQSTRLEIESLNHNSIRFGIESSVSERYFSHLALQFSQNNLLSEIKMTESGSAALLKQLQSGELDVAVLGSEDRIEVDNLIFEPLKRINFSVYTSLSSRYSGLARAQIATFEREPFVILSPDYLNYKIFQELVNDNEITPNIKFESASTNVAREMISDNLACGFLSDISSNDNPRLHKIELTNPVRPSSIMLVTNSETVGKNDLVDLIISKIKAMICD